MDVCLSECDREGNDRMEEQASKKVWVDVVVRFHFIVICIHGWDAYA